MHSISQLPYLAHNDSSFETNSQQIDGSMRLHWNLEPISALLLALCFLSCSLHCHWLDYCYSVAGSYSLEYSSTTSAIEVVFASKLDPFCDGVFPLRISAVAALFWPTFWPLVSVELQTFAVPSIDWQRSDGFHYFPPKSCANDWSICKHRSMISSENHSNWKYVANNFDRDSFAEFVRHKSARMIDRLSPFGHRSHSFWRAHANSTFSWFPFRRHLHRRSRQSIDWYFVAAIMDPIHPRNSHRFHLVASPVHYTNGNTYVCVRINRHRNSTEIQRVAVYIVRDETLESLFSIVSSLATFHRISFRSDWTDRCAYPLSSCSPAHRCEFHWWRAHIWTWNDRDTETNASANDINCLIFAHTMGIWVDPTLRSSAEHYCEWIDTRDTEHFRWFLWTMTIDSVYCLSNGYEWKHDVLRGSHWWAYDCLWRSDFPQRTTASTIPSWISASVISSHRLNHRDLAEISFSTPVDASMVKFVELNRWTRRILPRNDRC